MLGSSGAAQLLKMLGLDIEEMRAAGLAVQEFGRELSEALARIDARTERMEATMMRMEALLEGLSRRLTPVALSREDHDAVIAHLVKEGKYNGSEN